MTRAKRLVLLLLLPLLAGCTTPGQGAGGSGGDADEANFDPTPVLVSTFSSGRAEASIAVAANGHTIVALVGVDDAPRAWLHDGSSQGFSPLEGPDGPGDGDLAADGNDVHWVGLAGEAGRVPWQRHEGGAWSAVVDVSAGARLADRPFLDAREGEVAVVWAGGPDGIQVAVSSDRGATWAKPVAAARFVTGTHGGVAVGPNSAIAIAYASDPVGVFVALSVDGGATWSQHLVAQGHAWVWPAIAFDDTGALHVVWSTAHDGRAPSAFRAYGGALMPAPRVHHAVSSDGGRTWSPPVTLTAEGRAGFYPWMAARHGTVAVSWYDVPSQGGDGEGEFLVAMAGDGDAQRQRFETRSVTDGPIPLDLVCRTDGVCEERGPLGESSDLAIGPDGSVAAVWMQAGPRDAELWAARLAPPAR